MPDAEAAAQFAARYVAEMGRESVAARGVFCLGLSGGSSPVRFFEALAGLPEAEAPPWRETHVFWADERLVPPEDERSNYGLARRLLLSRVPLQPGQLHRVRGELGLLEAVEAYEAELELFFGPLAPENAQPRGLDLVHLGLGPDGHTASLFPGSPALLETSRRVAGVELPDMPPFVPRVTLTLPALNSSRQVLFLTGGPDRLALAHAVSEQQAWPGEAAGLLPAARVRPRGQTLWFASP